MESESTNGENTQKTTPESQEQTEKEQIPVVSRKQIGIRLLYTILFLVILGIMLVITKVVVVFQFIYFFSTRKPNESVRNFSTKFPPIHIEYSDISLCSKVSLLFLSPIFLQNWNPLKIKLHLIEGWEL